MTDGPANPIQYDGEGQPILKGWVDTGSNNLWLEDLPDSVWGAYIGPEPVYVNLTSRELFFWMEGSGLVPLTQQLTEQKDDVDPEEGEDGNYSNVDEDSEGKEDDDSSGDEEDEDVFDFDYLNLNARAHIEDEPGGELCGFQTVCNAALPIDTLDPNFIPFALLTALVVPYQGPEAADFVQDHLATSIMGGFRAYQDQLSKIDASSMGDSVENWRRDFGSREWPDKLVQFVAEFNNDKYLATTVCALRKAFDHLNKNLLDLNLHKDHSSACSLGVCLLYGPANDGLLKVVAACVGGVTGFLRRKSGTTVVFNTPHDITSTVEAGRFATMNRKLELPTSAVKNDTALPVTRFLGGRHFRASRAKGKYNLAALEKNSPWISEPEVYIRTVSFDEDSFLFLVNSHVLTKFTGEQLSAWLAKYMKLELEESLRSLAADADVAVHMRNVTFDMALKNVTKEIRGAGYQGPVGLVVQFGWLSVDKALGVSVTGEKRGVVSESEELPKRARVDGES